MQAKRIPGTAPSTRIRSCLGLGWAAALVGAMVFAQLVLTSEARSQDASRDAVKNLEAYAAYKSGDYDAARRTWEELAERGNTTALINLANMFQQGQGIAADERQAFSYVVKAAELGDSRAQHELGLAYERGALVERDIAQAGRWLQKSAEQGNPDGAFAYGVLLATSSGKGLDAATPAERADALFWLKTAKADGHPEAADYIAVIEGSD
jgi:TPR repeat protein